MADIHAKLIEEKNLRAIRARRRFKAAVRNVIYNISWIQGDEDYSSGITRSSIQKSINKLHQKRKSKDGQLTLQEISILRKDAKYRTEDEIKLLNKYIGSFKCFRLYPEDVRTELVKVTYFEYYGPKRTLIKENQKGHAMYFLLTGEVLIYKMQLDIMTEEYVQVQVNTTTAGNMFGEISLLHNIPRTATVITSAPCQLLVLKKKDFDRVLKQRLMQQWEEVRQAMLQFVYFDNWTAVAIQECCMLGKVQSYKPNEVIYGDKDKKKEKVSSEMTYFIIEGTCAVIEHLFVQETVRRGTKCYKIYDPPEYINVELPSTAPFSIEKLDNVSSTKESESPLAKELSPSKSEKFDKAALKSTSISCQKLVTLKSLSKTRIASKTMVIDIDKEDDEISNVSLPTDVTKALKESLVHIDDVEKKMQSLNRLQIELKERKHTYKPAIKLPSNVKLRFLQICTFRELATFFEGKLMENRRVISLTPVKVMKIPVYWLLARNKGNVWSRIEEYQKMNLPSKQDVFKAYIKRQKWQDYKRKLRNDIISKKKFYNSTTIHDVPYSIRVMSTYIN